MDFLLKLLVIFLTEYAIWFVPLALHYKNGQIHGTI